MKKKIKCVGKFGSNKRCFSCNKSNVCINTSVTKRMEEKNELQK